jgi:hypothetical protein
VSGSTRRCLRIESRTSGGMVVRDHLGARCAVAFGDEVLEHVARFVGAGIPSTCIPARAGQY